jgi:hypothetical protein
LPQYAEVLDYHLVVCLCWMGKLHDWLLTNANCLDHQAKVLGPNRNHTLLNKDAQMKSLAAARLPASDTYGRS